MQRTHLLRLFPFVFGRYTSNNISLPWSFEYGIPNLSQFPSAPVLPGTELVVSQHALCKPIKQPRSLCHITRSTGSTGSTFSVLYGRSHPARLAETQGQPLEEETRDAKPPSGEPVCEEEEVMRKCEEDTEVAYCVVSTADLVRGHNDPTRLSIALTSAALAEISSETGVEWSIAHLD
jgi:hypothetical protein